MLLRREEVVRPADGRVQRLLAGIGVAAAFQIQPAAEPLEQLLGREDRDTRGRELERERKIVEPVAQLGRRSRLAELRAKRAGARREQRGAVVLVERRHRPRMLALQLQPLPARHEQLRPARFAKPRDVPRKLRQQVLGVVDQQQRALGGERVGERLLERDSRPLPHVERLRDGVERESRVPKRSERHPPDAVGHVLGHLGRGLQSQTGLPGAARARQRQQPDLVVTQEADDLLQLARTAEKRRRRNGQVRLPQALDRREALASELEHALRRGQVLQPVLAEIADVVGGDEVTRRLGQQHLAAVAGSGDPCGAVHVHPDVPLARHDGLTGVDSNANADRALAELGLCFGRGSKRVRGAREGDEERVSLRVHFGAAVTCERVAQHRAVLAQELGVALAVLTQQPRRALDVREEERNRARWKLTHGFDHETRPRRRPAPRSRSLPRRSARSPRVAPGRGGREAGTPRARAHNSRRRA